MSRVEFRGKRPHHLLQVEGIDGLINDDNDLGVTHAVRCGEYAEPDILGKAAHAPAGRNDHDETVGIGCVDGLDLWKLFFGSVRK
jgi:hypothetical protein